MLQRLYSVALNAFVETIRQPIYAVIVLAMTLLMILNVSLAAFTLEDDDKLLLDLGLSTLLLCGLFLAAFSAAGVLSREIENKTALTVISKPVSRPVFVVGKFLGLLAALTVAFYLGVLAFILAVRHGVMERTSDPWDLPVLALGFGSAFAAVLTGAYLNYVHGRHFASTSIATFVALLTVSVVAVAFLDEHFKPIPFASNFVGGQVILATVLVFLIVMVTAAVAVAAATRLGQLGTLVVCTGVVGLGVVSDFAFGQKTSSLAKLTYHLVPNVGPFWNPIVSGW